ncbi:hypothetical protein F5X97DRAFT_339722 [Nemania serpens]|nr:hypothetical protein F5X97DRAFT_339722 [Nemania serpens]
MAEENPVVGWQANPGRRGTLTIIENCLFTIFTCTWSVQHLNVPGLDETWWQPFLRKCKWTVFTLFFPEFLMAHAILEFVMVVGDMRLLDNEGRLEDAPRWFFLYSRWPLSNPDDTESGRPKPLLPSEDAEQKDPTRWTFTHCYFANMGGFYIRDHDGQSSVPKDDPLMTMPALNTSAYQMSGALTTSHFVKYWQRIKIPRLSEDDLKDKSKTDYFTKAIAALQISQLMLSLIFRHVQHLAFSQLETLTLAFAICGILTYICSWYKPQNVQRPIEVSWRGPVDDIVPKIQRRTFDSLWRVLTNSKVKNDRQLPERIPNDNIPKTKAHETHYALCILAALTAGFGSIHAIAWNFEFPTFTEQLLWRVATVVSTALPSAALLAIPLSQITVSWGDSSEFRYTCLDVMREYSWQVAGNHDVQIAIKDLTEVCDNKEGHKHFREIFGDSAYSQDFLGKRLREYIQQNAEIRGGLPNNFVSQFEQLVEILSGSINSKRLWDAARTDTYPRRSLSGPLINDGIIYLTSILYCLARLSIIGVAFSSLRWMPDSVYASPWTDYIPSVQ